MAKPELSVDVRDEELGLPAEDEPLLSEAKSAENNDEVLETGGSDILQFACPMYYADESDPVVKIDIIRMGTIKGVCAARFCTEDGTAKSSQQYGSVSGRMVFADGEYVKTIEVPILDDGEWKSTVEFTVNLTQAENCNLGLYLHNCRVKIMNVDAFPSNMFKEDSEKENEGNDVRKTHPWTLFRDYCCLNYSSAGLKWQTLLVLVLDQLSSVFLFGSLFIGVYIVDTIFARGGSSAKRLIHPDRYGTAVIVAFWYVVPQFVLYAWDAAKVLLDIQGISRKFLQMSLMQSYLEYTPASRHKISPADMNVAIEIGAEQVAESYVAALTAVGLVGRILIIELFIILFQPEPLAICMVVVMVAVLIAFTILRVGVSQRQQVRVEERFMLVATLCDDACRKFRLFADYFKRPLMTDMFGKCVDEYGKERVPEAMIKLNNEYTTKFLSGICITVYIVAMAPGVLDGHVSLGIFLATITIFSTYLSDAITDLNKQMMLIVTSFVPLQEFTMFLNMPLELPALKEIVLHRTEKTHKNRHKLLSPRDASKEDDVAFRSDLMPIKISDVSFDYSSAHGPVMRAGSKLSTPVLRKMDLSFPQGKMVAVVGPHNSGKSTLVSLLCNILVPTQGHIFVPGHLRVLHVSREPIFLRASLLHNLAFGLASKQAIDAERIKNILSYFFHNTKSQDESKPDAGELKDLIDTLDADLRRQGDRVTNDVGVNEIAHGDWLEQLTFSQRFRLHLARAFIANPEIMVLHHSVQHFNEKTAHKMLDVVRQHVTERGLCLPEEGRTSRRPRGVFYTTENLSQAMQADTILQGDTDIESPTYKTFMEVSHSDLKAQSKTVHKWQAVTEAAHLTPKQPSEE